MPTSSARPMRCGDVGAAAFECVRNQPEEGRAEQRAGREAHEVRQHGGARSLAERQEHACGQRAQQAAERGEDDDQCERTQGTYLLRSGVKPVRLARACVERAVGRQPRDRRHASGPAAVAPERKEIARLGDRCSDRRRGRCGPRQRTSACRASRYRSAWKRPARSRTNAASCSGSRAMNAARTSGPTSKRPVRDRRAEPRHEAAGRDTQRSDRRSRARRRRGHATRRGQRRCGCPSTSVKTTGRQSAVMTTQTRPGSKATAASARGGSDGRPGPRCSTTSMPCTCSSQSGSAGNPASRRNCSRFACTAAGSSPTWRARLRLA